VTVQVRRQALVLRSAAQVFDVIEAAEFYPQFLPWCAGAAILQRDEQVVVARLTVAWHKVRFSFVTRNPKRRPEWMAIGLEEGPFRQFAGTWQLTPLAESGCRVDFSLVYEFNASVLDPLAGPMFQRSIDHLVDAFVVRTEQLHPSAPLTSPPENPP
jgi:ribosome-associated toxin RatA of RatAB toxin-antitoxin module